MMTRNLTFPGHDITHVLPCMCRSITPFLRMSFLLFLLVVNTVGIIGFSPESKASRSTYYIDGCQLHVNWSSSIDLCSAVLIYNNVTNTSHTYNASDDITHETFPVDSASILDVVFREGCHGNQTMFNSTVTTFPDLGPLPDVTTVNISNSIELICTTGGAMVNIHTAWRRPGSEIPLSNETVLHLPNVTYTDTGSYVCFVQYQSCNVNGTSNTKYNLTRTTYVDVQGPPLFIFPTEKKSYQVAVGQPIMLSITIASSPSPKPFVILWKSDSTKSLTIDVHFNRKKASLTAAKYISGETPVYTTYVKLTNITSFWTGNYILYINNSHGYDTYEFSINVHRQPKVSVWESHNLEIVSGGIGGLIFLALVMGIFFMCYTRHKQNKAIQENIKELVEAKNKERKGALEAWDVGTRPEGELDNFTNDEEQYRQLQSMNTFNDAEDNI